MGEYIQGGSLQSGEISFSYVLYTEICEYIITSVNVSSCLHDKYASISLPLLMFLAVFTTNMCYFSEIHGEKICFIETSVFTKKNS